MTDSTPGVCVWLTGRSGAGKTSLTAALVPLLEGSGQIVSVFDTVPLLAKAPGEKTSEGKLMRKAFVASEVVRHGGTAICVTISARQVVRRRAREIVGSSCFVEVHLDLPATAVKGRRGQRGSRRTPAKALQMVIRRLWSVLLGGSRIGYEAPEVRVDVTRETPEEAATRVFEYLRREGFLAEDGAST